MKKPRLYDPMSPVYPCAGKIRETDSELYGEPEIILVSYIHPNAGDTVKASASGSGDCPTDKANDVKEDASIDGT